MINPNFVMNQGRMLDEYIRDNARLKKRIAELEKAMETFRAEAQLPWHYFRSVLDKPEGGADE